MEIVYLVALIQVKEVLKFDHEISSLEFVVGGRLASGYCKDVHRVKMAVYTWKVIVTK